MERNPSPSARRVFAACIAGLVCAAAPGVLPTVTEHGAGGWPWCVAAVGLLLGARLGNRCDRGRLIAGMLVASGAAALVLALGTDVRSVLVLPFGLLGFFEPLARAQLTRGLDTRGRLQVGGVLYGALVAGTAGWQELLAHCADRFGEQDGGAIVGLVLCAVAAPMWLAAAPPDPVRGRAAELDCAAGPPGRGLITLVAVIGGVGVLAEAMSWSIARELIQAGSAQSAESRWFVMAAWLALVVVVWGLWLPELRGARRAVAAMPAGVAVLVCGHLYGIRGSALESVAIIAIGLVALGATAAWSILASALGGSNWVQGIATAGRTLGFALAAEPATLLLGQGWPLAKLALAFLVTLVAVELVGPTVARLRRREELEARRSHC